MVDMRGRYGLSDDDLCELIPTERSIVKYLRLQCSTKKGSLMGMQVVYFNGLKAIECLMELSNDRDYSVCFSSKHDAVQILRKFLDNEMFRRVVKVYEDKDEVLSSLETSCSVRQWKNKSTGNAVSTVEKTTITEDDLEEKIEKKKFKFELHDDQTFIDSFDDFYVWIYSPTRIKQYIIGSLLIIGCIGVCLFPLWPSQVRIGVYYLSIILATLIASLLLLAGIKYIIFAIVWFITMGKIKFWLLPSLTEDVGFMESFIPLYVINITTEKNKIKKDKNSLVNTEQAKEISRTRANSTDDINEDNKSKKFSDEDFEIISKDEFETK